MREKYGKLNLVTSMKLTMSLYSLYTKLSTSSSPRKAIEKSLNLPIRPSLLKTLDDRAFKATTPFRPRQSYSGDDSLFGDKNEGNNRVRNDLSQVDDSLWETASGSLLTSSKAFRPKKQSDQVQVLRNLVSWVETNKLKQSMHSFLREAVIDTLLTKPDEKLAALENIKFKEQLLYVFSTWYFNISVHKDS